MAKKKGAIAAKARAKREQQRAAPDPSACADATGPIVHADGRRVHRSLMNLGNTCFINSVAQCLNVSMPFSDALIRLAVEGLDGMAGGLVTVMRGIRATDDTEPSLQKFSPKAFHTALVNQFPWYFGKQQHDAHEFLRTLLGAVSDERTVAERAAIEDSMTGDGDGPIPDLDAPSACGACVGSNFRGHFLSTSLCWSCGHVTARLDPFLDLSLDLPKPSGTCRKPLGLVSAAETGVLGNLEDEEPPPNDAPVDAALDDGPLLGRWAANRDAEALAALREITPMLVERMVVQSLRRIGVSAGPPSGTPVQISLARASKKSAPRWGFRWSESRLQNRTFVVGRVVEDSLLDKWNMKRKATGSADRAIYPGDQLIEVNGDQEYEAMRQRLKWDNELDLHFVRSGAKDVAGSGLHDETDDEAEEIRAAQAAALEERRRHFFDQSESCYQALANDLQGIFGAARTCNRASNGHIDLQDCLEQFSMVEALEDEYEPVYRCATCSTHPRLKTYASRRLWLWPAGLPPTLTIQLKRFRRYADDFVKSVTSVPLPAELDLSGHVLDEARFETLKAHAAVKSDFDSLAAQMAAPLAGSLRYELYAIVEHQGSQMQDGHYVAYVNAGSCLAKEEWLGISDAKVWKCDRADVLKVEAYIAFYRRTDVMAKDQRTEAAPESSVSVT